MKRRRCISVQLELPLGLNRPGAEEIRALITAWKRRQLELEHLRMLTRSRVELEQLPN